MYVHLQIIFYFASHRRFSPIEYTSTTDLLSDLDTYYAKQINAYWHIHKHTQHEVLLETRLPFLG